MNSSFFFLPQNVTALSYEDKILTITGTIIVPDEMLFKLGSPDLIGMTTLSTTRTLDKQFQITSFDTYKPIMTPYKYYTFAAEGFVISFAPGIHNCNMSELDAIVEAMKKDGIKGKEKVTFLT